MKEPTILVLRHNDLEYIDEILSITSEAGLEVKETLVIRKVDSRCFLTPGKILKVKYLINNNNIKKLCIYDDLKPRQISCLLKELGIDIIDRVMLILSVFQRHAGSKEALMQIEIARLKHEAPLIRDWIKRAKTGELPGFLSLGRYAVDVYYRHIKRRISKLNKELVQMRIKRENERVKRKNLGFIHVSIVGYTNAGKTTLFNALSNLDKPTGTEMFTTLSTKITTLKICGRTFALIDTVGFIRKIPVTIIESFKAVLEEISYSDLIFLVVDISKDEKKLLDEVNTSIEILRTIGAIGKPIVFILNKIDLANDSNIDKKIHSVLENVKGKDINIIDYVPVSALNRINIDRVKEVLCRFVELH